MFWSCQRQPGWPALTIAKCCPKEESQLSQAIQGASKREPAILIVSIVSNWGLLVGKFLNGLV